MRALWSKICRGYGTGTIREEERPPLEAGTGRLVKKAGCVCSELETDCAK
jgi:hypothetical protein